MPTEAELARLEALVGRLVPLADTRRGQLIRADSWNTVVGALIELARATLADSRNGAVPAHTHADQVKLGWLDPALRDLVSRGPLADPAAVARVAAVERRLERLSARLDEALGRVDEWRELTNDALTRDLRRESDLTSLRRVVEGQSDPREEILGLRQSLGSIQRDLGTALEVGASLEVDGERVEMAAVLDRLAAVEVLRRRLTQPSGELLDAAALERRLTGLTNTLVTQEVLDAAIEARQVEIRPEQVAGIQQQVQVAVLARVDDSFDQLSGELRAETESSLAAVTPTAERAVADALPGLQQSILTTTRSESATAVQASQAASLAAAQGLVGALDGELRAALTGEINAVRAGLPAVFQQEFDRQLATRLAGIEGTLGGLDQRTRGIESSVAEQGRSLGTVAARVEAVARDSQTARGQMEGRLRSEMRTVAREEVATFQTQLPGLVGTEVERIDRQRTPVGPVVGGGLINRGGLVINPSGAPRPQDAPAPFPGPVPESASEPEPADFTELAGIGETFSGRLAAAGITTFAALAALEPAALAEILGTTPARVERDDLIGQARRRVGD